MNNTEKTTGIRGTIAKILFVIGVIIILTLLIFLIIRFVPMMFNGLANVGSSISNTVRGGKTLTVTVNDQDLEDNENFLVSWEHTSSTDGTYHISHECRDNTSFDLVTESGTKRLICNVPYDLGPNTRSVQLISNYNDANSFTDVPITISFTETGKNSPKTTGEVIVTLKKDGDTTPSEQSNGPNGDLSNAVIESAPVRTSPTTIAPGGLADFVILDLYSFPNQSALQFTVRNFGGQVTGPWNFSYSTPTDDGDIIHSPLQPSLLPGQGIRYTITFSEQDEDEEGVAIVVDSFRAVFESNETNNASAIVITGNGTGGNGGYDSNDDADFEIEDLEVGYLSGNRFREDDRLDEGDDAAIRFTVRNTGGEETEDWRFEINNIPYSNDDNYRSNRQNSLEPGESVEIIVEFENIDEGDYDIEVEVDSEDDTDEESERNNDDSVDLDVRD